MYESEITEPVVVVSKELFDEYKDAWAKYNKRQDDIHEEAKKLVESMETVPLKIQLCMEPVTVFGFSIGSQVAAAKYVNEDKKLLMEQPVTDFIVKHMNWLEGENLRTYRKTVTELCERMRENDKRKNVSLIAWSLLGGIVIGIIGAVVAAIFI